MNINRLSLQQKIKPYSELMRLHSVDVVFLALAPAWCGIMLAANNFRQMIYYLLLFLLGALLMRSVGCIVNDIFDRKFDAKVVRTKDRPIARGLIEVSQALSVLAVLCSVGLIILLTTNVTTVILGILCFVATILYPLFKRFFWWPQLILGITFNMGALMGWSVIRNNISLEAVLLYLGCVFWTLGYDTIYAHQDKDDDIKLGLKSTAIRFGDETSLWLKRFYITAVTLWLSLGIKSAMHYPFYLAILGICVVFYYQHKKSDFDNSLQCMYMFRINIVVSVLLFLGVLFGRV